MSSIRQPSVAGTVVQSHRQTPEGRSLSSFYNREDYPPVQMATCLTKAINSHETAVKEKHVRSAIIGTYQERGATTFWECVHRLPLKDNPIVCWKFCHVLHKVLQEGHEKVLRDSQRYKPMLQEHGRFWGHLKTGGYGELVKSYCSLLYVKLNFHHRNVRIPGNLQIDESKLIQDAGDEENELFELSVEMLNYLDGILELQIEIFKTMDSSRCNSMTNAGQCRLKPLIPCIQDSMLLYDYVTKILFRLHAKLPPDMLNGHRDRFMKVFKGLQKFYEKTMSLQYFKNLIQIQHLPKYPPNFLVQSELANYQPSRVTVLDSERDLTDSQSDIISESLVSLEDTTSTNGSTSPDPGAMALYLERDRQFKELEYEHERLKNQLESFKHTVRVQLQQLHFEIEELKHELDQKNKELIEKNEIISKLKQHKCTDSPEALERCEKLETQCKALEEKFVKMKDLYTNLSGEHVSLLRKKAAVDKELMDTKKAVNNQSELGIQIEELRKEKAVLETSLSGTIEDKSNEIEFLEQKVTDLKSKIIEIEQSKVDLANELTNKIEDKCEEVQELQQTILQLKSQVQSAESSKSLVEQELKSSIVENKDEIKKLRESKAFLEDSVNSLRQKLDELEAKNLESVKALSESEDKSHSLQTRVQNLTQQFENAIREELDYANESLDNAIEVTLQLIKKELEDLDNPKTGPEPGLRDFFTFRCEAFGDVIRKYSAATMKGFDSPRTIDTIRHMTQVFGPQVYFFLIYGNPLSRSERDIQKGEEFLQEIRNFGLTALEILSMIKSRSEKIPSGFDAFTIQWKKVLEMAKWIGMSLPPEADAAEILDTELQAMEQAIEEAAKKMEEMLKHSRASDTGVQLEVNEKLIDSCSSLMNAIRVLVQKSKHLQREIVAQGRGNASAKEFYKRNNQWTDGLISAAKAVGIGAKLLLENADKAVTSRGGGFEYLVASSQAIAASTIQLVVASQVRADRSSNNLLQVKQASTGVKTATAHVVATAKDCALMIEESDEIDMTKLSPHQSKRLELELQAELLRQESELEKSRRKLSALRQHYYHNSDA